MNCSHCYPPDTPLDFSDCQCLLRSIRDSDAEADQKLHVLSYYYGSLGNIVTELEKIDAEDRNTWLNYRFQEIKEIEKNPVGGCWQLVEVLTRERDKCREKNNLLLERIQKLQVTPPEQNPSLSQDFSLHPVSVSHELHLQDTSVPTPLVTHNSSGTHHESQSIPPPSPNPADQQDVIATSVAETSQHKALSNTSQRVGLNPPEQNSLKVLPPIQNPLDSLPQDPTLSHVDHVLQHTSVPTLVVSHNSSGTHHESGHNILATHEADTSQQEARRNAVRRVRFNSSQAAKVGSTPPDPQTRSKTKTTDKANEEERIKELDMQVRRSPYKRKKSKKGNQANTTNSSRPANTVLEKSTIMDAQSSRTTARDKVRSTNSAQRGSVSSRKKDNSKKGSTSDIRSHSTERNVPGTSDVNLNSATARSRALRSRKSAAPQGIVSGQSHVVGTEPERTLSEDYSPEQHSGSPSDPVCFQMENSGASTFNDTPVGLDAFSEEEYYSQSTSLKEFTEIPTIEKAWTLKSDTGGSQVMFSISQPNLLENKKRRYVSYSHIAKERDDSVQFHWAAFPIEMGTASLIVPSPSGSKLLVVRNSENDSPTCFEIWSSSQVEREFHVPSSMHGSVYSDGWFEGISWNSDETLIAYVAEEPVFAKPTFTCHGDKKGNCPDKDCNSWKGQGDWEEGWGEAYAGKRLPKLFVININSGEVRAVDGIEKSVSIGQVIWAPSMKDSLQYLVFVGWPSGTRKFGIKYCTNRPCSLYAVRAPSFRSEPEQSATNANLLAVVLTESISSAFFPRFSPDGKFLVFLSSKSAVDSGAHNATDSLHRIDWSIDAEPCPHNKIVDVVPVVMCAEDGSFPGLYCSNILSNLWLSDGRTMILSSAWGSILVVLAVDVLSGDVSRISPSTSEFSWDVLTLDCDNIIAVCSSPVDVPEIKYGYLVGNACYNTKWNWLDISSPITKCFEKVRSLLSSKEFCIMPIPIRDVSENLSKGASKPYEAIFASSKSMKHDACDPLIVVLHGGPHCVSLSSFSKSSAFLCSLGFSLLLVSYRGSLGFGEEALQSLPGRVGTQDVNDVLAAIDHVTSMGLADPSKIAAVGISHGGFLTTHLIGQAPDKFAAAAARNPVCNLALMVGTTDIPDWCYFEAFGSEAKSNFTAAPSAEHLALFYDKSPISHVSKVKAPTLMVLGAQDLRVPITDGLQYARALKENGVEVKVMMFSDDIHELDRPRTDFESFLNIGVWFKKYCS